MMKTKVKQFKESNELVSIVIINYNGRGMVEECISSFAKNTAYPNFEIIVVDNASTDGSYETIEKKYLYSPHILILRSKRNLGFAGGCEFALKYCKGEYICLTNHDTKVDAPTWLNQLLDVIDNDPTIGACCSKTLSWDNPSKIDSLGMSMNRAGIIWQEGVGRQNNDVTTEKFEVFGWQVPVLIRRKAIENSGGLFDPKYFIIHDDTDSSWRIRLAGYKILAVPESAAYHKRSGTISTLPPKIVVFYAKRNLTMTILKNYAKRSLILYFPFFLSIHFALILLSLKQKKLDHTFGIISGIAWNLKNLKYVMEQRRKIQSLRRVPDDYILRLIKKVDWRYMYRIRIAWPP